MTLSRKTFYRTAGWLVLLCGGSLLAPLAAQNAPGEADEAKLDTAVNLRLGETMLPAVMKAISEQTGLQVEAAEYLHERRLTVWMQGVTARAALDALSQLYDWTWYKTDTGRYRLARRTMRAPRRLADVSSYLQAALPRDIRTYLALPPLPRRNPGEVTRFQTSAQMSMTVEKAKQALTASLASDLGNGRTISYDKLTPEQKEELLLTLLFARYDDLAELLHDDPGPHQMDVSTVLLALEPPS